MTEPKSYNRRGNLTRMLTTISERKPLLFFGIAGIISIALGVVAGIRVVNYLAKTGEMTTGTALISALLLGIGIFSIFTGIILNALSKRNGGS